MERKYPKLRLCKRVLTIKVSALYKNIKNDIENVQISSKGTTGNLFNAIF